MQTSNYVRIICLSLLISFLSGFHSMAKAQTFAGRSGLTPTPTNLRVIITARSQSPLLRILYENKDNSLVHIQIQDTKGYVVGDELRRQAKYAGEFDMSLLPAGDYWINLQTNQAHYREMVRVELLGGRYPVVTVGGQNQPTYVLLQPQVAAQ